MQNADINGVEWAVRRAHRSLEHDDVPDNTHTADVQPHHTLPRKVVDYSPWVALQQTSALASKLQF